MKNSLLSTILSSIAFVALVLGLTFIANLVDPISDNTAVAGDGAGGSNDIMK